jgi:hypothetical protein
MSVNCESVAEVGDVMKARGPYRVPLRATCTES